jgi:hypothetical protein
VGVEYFPSSYIGETIEVIFNEAPVYEKSPDCPDAFLWRGEIFRVVELLEEWRDYKRRGRMEKNMRPEHASRAATHGSLGVGRFYFRVRVEGERFFELYYDRKPLDVDDKKGHWYLVGERKPV